MAEETVPPTPTSAEIAHTQAGVLFDALALIEAVARNIDDLQDGHTGDQEQMHMMSRLIHMAHVKVNKTAEELFEVVGER